MKKRKEKEFDRSVCYTFFNAYLQQAKQIKEQFGFEMAYEYYIALSEYALYQKEHDNPIVNMFIAGLKDTINANQDRRASGFAKEDTEMTNKILQYKEQNPDATQRKIANAVGCSAGKVNAVLNANDNPNDNNTDNANSNNNTVNVNMNIRSPECADTREKDLETKRERELVDLSDTELEELSNDYRKGMRFPELSKKYSLIFKRDDGSYALTKSLPDDIKSITNARKRNNEKNGRDDKTRKMLSELNLSIDEGNELVKNLFQHDSVFEIQFGGDENLETIYDTGLNAKDLLAFFRENILATNAVYYEYIPKGVWDIKYGGADRIYGDYGEYLTAFIAAPEEMTEFAQNEIEKKKSPIYN